MAWEPADKEEYIDALHQAQLKTEQHKWEQAQGLQAAKDEADAKANADNAVTGKPADTTPKRKSWL